MSRIFFCAILGRCRYYQSVYNSYCVTCNGLTHLQPLYNFGACKIPEPVDTNARSDTYAILLVTRPPPAHPVTKAQEF